MWIVRLALRRTYTFVVVALLIAVLGAVSIYRMSTDIFPEIDIPVVSVVWQYTGMPADEIEARIIYLNERILTTSVNDIEHIESQSLDGVGVIRIYFHPGAKIAEAEAQVTATCQTLLKIMPPGITPPYIVRYSATSVPIVQIAVSSDTLTEQQTLRLLPTTSSSSGWAPSRRRGSRTLGAANGGRSWSISTSTPSYARGLSPNDVTTAISNQNLIVPAGTAKIGDSGVQRQAQQQPEPRRRVQRHPGQDGQRHPDLRQGRGPRRATGYAVQTNVVRRDGRRAVLMTILKGEGASTLSVVRRVRERHARHPGPASAGDRSWNFLFDQSVFVRAAVDGGAQGRGDRGRADGPDDPLVPRLVAEHADRRHLDPAVDPGLGDRPVGPGPLAQHHDAGRDGPGGRHPRG